MNDPYKVLNVPYNATDEEIKQAYRKLAKKYHPDRYQNSPLAESASEKMKEINDAYDRITSERKTGKHSNSGSYGNYYTSQSDSTSSDIYREVRILINSERYDQAEALLDSILSIDRDANWYYYKSVLAYRKGWLEEAYNYASTACHIDPNNVEYQAFYNRVAEQRRGNYGGYRPSSADGCGCCDMLMCMLCSDCFCNGCCGT